MAAGEYHAAHEALEGAWLRAPEPEKSFLKGLIHAAVALYHYQRGNGHGARVKYASCRRYLEPFRPRHAGLELEVFLGEMETFFRALLALPPGSPPPTPGAPWPAPPLHSLSEADCGD